MKIISSLISTSLMALIGLPSASNASRNDLATLFDEDTLLYVEIPDVPQLQDDWKSNPFYELLQREEVKEFTEALLERLKTEEDFKDGWAEFEDFLGNEKDQEIMEGLLSGQIAFGLSRIDFLSMIPNPMVPHGQAHAKNKPIPNLWLVFNYDDDELYARLVKDMEEEEDEFIEYEDFNVILEQDLVVAYNKDIVVVTNTEETAKNLINRYLENSSQSSLADNDNFQNGFLRLYDDSEIFYYLDLTFIADLAEQAAIQYEDVLMPMVQNGQLAPPNNILEALGLDSIQGLSAGVDLDPSELRFKNLFMIESNNGFFGKAFNHYGNSLPDTSFLGEELRQATAGGYNISNMLHDLEDTVATISPFAGQMYLMQKSQFEQMLSIQIDEALINNFSGSVYVAAGETPNTAAAAMATEMGGLESYLNQGNSIIIGINDRISLEALIDNMLGAFGQQERITKQDYLGVSNYVVNTPAPGPGPTFFISDQHLIFEQSNPDWGKLVVSMMQNPGQPIFERRDLRDALNELPPDPVGVNYNDTEKVLTFFTKMISDFTMGSAFAAAQAGEEEESDALEKLNVPVIEDFNYFTLANTYREDDDLYQEGVMRPKSQ